MTPHQDYTRFCCPNSSCDFYAQVGQSNIKHRSWTGKNKNIQRLKCTGCQKEFSSRSGTILARSSLPIDKTVRILKCFRWGVPDHATADICEVDADTVGAVRLRGAERAKIHHDNEAQGLKDPAAQADELYVRMGTRSSCWLAASILVSSLFVVGICLGARNQSMADRLIAETYLRCSWLRALFTDGWQCYLGAIMRCFGEMYRPRRRNHRGPQPKSRLRITSILYAQVVKMCDVSYKLIGIQARALIGSMKECLNWIKLFKIGTKIHTAHIERFWGTFRCHQPFARRRTRCFVKTKASCEARTWMWVSLYNWVVTHASLTINGIRRTPAMAAGLVDHALSYEEYILMPIFVRTNFQERLQKHLEYMNSSTMVQAAKRTTLKKEVSMMWEKPPDNKIAPLTGEVAQC
jgi:transposase-like protein